MFSETLEQTIKVAGMDNFRPDLAQELPLLAGEKLTELSRLEGYISHRTTTVRGLL